MLSPTSQTAVSALDDKQQHAAERGYHATLADAPEVSLTNSTTAIETEHPAGHVMLAGERTPVDAGTLTHAAGPVAPANPRWDTIVVRDTSAAGERPTASVEIVEGTPQPVLTDDSGTEYRGESAYQPWPADSIGMDVVVLALVWIPGGATSNQDLGADVADPVIDRRLTGRELPARQTRSATVTANGWYRIASNGDVQAGATNGDRAYGEFVVSDRQAQLHSTTAFAAGVHFNSNPTLSLGNRSWFAGSGAIRKVRLVTGDSFEGSAVEVYVDRGSQSSVDVEYSLYRNRQQAGWTAEPWVSGEAPSGWDTTTLDFEAVDAVGGWATNYGTNTAVVGRDGTVHSQAVETPFIGGEVFRQSPQTIETGTTDRISFTTKETENPPGAFDLGSNVWDFQRPGVYKFEATVRGKEPSTPTAFIARIQTGAGTDLDVDVVESSTGRHAVGRPSTTHTITGTGNVALAVTNLTNDPIDVGGGASTGSFRAWRLGGVP